MEDITLNIHLFDFPVWFFCLSCCLDFVFVILLLLFFFKTFYLGVILNYAKLQGEYREYLNTSVFNDTYVYTVHTHTEWAFTFMFFFRIF